MQHTAVVKALEARKRYEKRERRREEMKTEKWAVQRRWKSVAANWSRGATSAVRRKTCH